MKRTNKDWLDEITEAVYEVDVEGHTVFLRQPDLASVLLIQDHTLLTPEEREKYKGGVHGVVYDLLLSVHPCHRENRGQDGS